MALNVLAEYRALFKARHGVACPLTDAQMRTALAAASPSAVGEHVWPLDLTALTAIEASVASNFAAMNIVSYPHGQGFAPDDYAIDNASAEGFDCNWSESVGPNGPFEYQVQVAPDATDVYVDFGSPQSDNAEVVVTGLVTATAYRSRVKVTDRLGQVVYSNEDTITTS